MNADSSMPTVYAFDFPSPGYVVYGGDAPKLVLRNRTIRVLAWVYLYGNEMPAEQTILSIPGALALGVRAKDGKDPVLCPEIWDYAEERYTFEAGQIPTDQWVLLELVVTRPWSESGSLVGLVNGNVASTIAIPVSAGGINPPAESKVYLGAHGTDGARPFHGQIQSVLMSSTTLEAPLQTWACAITPHDMISNWGPSTPIPSGGAKIIELPAPPATAYAAPTPPPSPTGLSAPMPQSASAGPTFKMVVPSARSRYTLLSVSQGWSLIAALSATPGSKTEYDISYTSGVSLMDSETQTVGVSIGMEAGFDAFGFSAKLSTTLSYSDQYTQQVTVTEQETITQSFSVDNPPVPTRVAWWQPVTTFSTFQVTNTGVSSASVVSPSKHDFIMTAYPSSGSELPRAAVRMVREKLVA